MRCTAAGGLFTLLVAHTHAGCVTSSAFAAERQGPPVYVPVFVDETEDSGLGLSLPSAMQRLLHRYAPERLALGADGDTYVLDGTIGPLRELALDGGVQLELCATVLVHRTGARRGEGSVVELCSTAEYAEAASPAGSARARRRALAVATEELAMGLLEKTLRTISASPLPEGTDDE